MCIRERKISVCNINRLEHKSVVNVEELAERLRRVINILLTVSYTHLRPHETVLDPVSRLLLEKKKQPHQQNQ